MHLASVFLFLRIVELCTIMCVVIYDDNLIKNFSYQVLTTNWWRRLISNRAFRILVCMWIFPFVCNAWTKSEQNMREHVIFARFICECILLCYFQWRILHFHSGWEFRRSVSRGYRNLKLAQRGLQSKSTYLNFKLISLIDWNSVKLKLKLIDFVLTTGILLWFSGSLNRNTSHDYFDFCRLQSISVNSNMASYLFVSVYFVLKYKVSVTRVF